MTFTPTAGGQKTITYPVRLAEECTPACIAVYLPSCSARTNTLNLSIWLALMSIVRGIAFDKTDIDKDLTLFPFAQTIPMGRVRRLRVYQRYLK